MFKNQVDDGVDFCEAYKSEILGNTTVQEESSNRVFKILTILLLLIAIIVVSIYGYNYIIKNNSSDSSMPPSSIQIDDKELIVAPEDEEVSIQSKGSETKESDIDNMAKEVQLVMLNSEKRIASNEKKVESLLTVPTTIQTDYLADLDKLSKEIDKEN